MSLSIAALLFASGPILVPVPPVISIPAAPGSKSNGSEMPRRADPPAAACATVCAKNDAFTIPLRALEDSTRHRTPIEMMTLSVRLLKKKGREPDASFWYNEGVLRWLIRLRCYPDLPPDGEPALFASLRYVVGEDIGEFAEKRPDEWRRTWLRALDWDLKNPTTDAEHCAASRKQVREDIAASLNK